MTPENSKALYLISSGFVADDQCVLTKSLGNRHP